MKRFKEIIFCALIIFSAHQSFATHLRAGEILAKKIGSLQYEFTVIIYKNTDPSAAALESVTLHFGDNQSQSASPDPVKTQVSETTAKYTFTFTKTYSSPGTYKVYIIEQNRNADIVNITNSINVNFYLETMITIDPYMGQNSSPEMKVPPIDNANTGQIFTHNPGAWDADGDSIAYKLGVPKYVPNDTAVTAPGYKPLTDPSFSSPPNCTSTLTLDPKKGDLVWNTPCKPGLYNIAIIIEEYRNGKLIGYITRDMQINVLQTNNEPPKLFIPNDTCITAGALLNGTITGTDSPFSQINLTAFSGVFQLATSPATFSYQTGLNPQFTPAVMFFNWQTTCSHIRKEAYNIEFKAEDNPGQSNRLVAIKTWSINIIAPKPEKLTATTLNKTITLNWKKYACSSNASKIHIMRKDCPSDSAAMDSCSSGVSTSDGFVQIGTVDPNVTTFTDSQGLKRGAVYCYRIYAEFPEPSKGLSRASNELCVTLSLDVPIIFKVSVDTVNGTSKTDGKIDLAWTLPRKIDSALYVPPYTYDLWRFENNNASSATLVKSAIPFNDTTLIDQNLNTEEKSYNYFLNFKYAGNKIRENTDTASSVDLKGFSKNKKVILTWDYNVPWNNIGKYHYVWRSIDTTFLLIDSVLATSDNVNYTDIGQYKNIPLENGKKYTYYVTTQGDYTCPDQVKRVNLPFLLRNNSQQVSVIPSDTNRPCPPELKILPINCKARPIIPKIYWKPNLDVFCDSAITSYRIYYSSKGQESFLFLIEKSKTDTLFIHENNPSPTGCYYVTAFSATNLESSRSNVVCTGVENCENFYDIPNVFTPNGDMWNETLKPTQTSENVQSVDFKLYNRWGTLIFKTSDININWDGKNATDGLYYYIASVTFVNGTNQKINGWVQLLR